MVGTLTAALEHEHHEIDAGIEAFLDGLSGGEWRTGDLTRVVEPGGWDLSTSSRRCAPPGCWRRCW